MKEFKGLAILIAAYIFTATALAQATRPTVYLEPQNGFEDYLAAAIEKKNVPIDLKAMLT